MSKHPHHQRSMKKHDSNQHKKNMSARMDHDRRDQDMKNVQEQASKNKENKINMNTEKETKNPNIQESSASDIANADIVSSTEKRQNKASSYSAEKPSINQDKKPEKRLFDILKNLGNPPAKKTITDLHKISEDDFLLSNEEKSDFLLSFKENYNLLKNILALSLFLHEKNQKKSEYLYNLAHIGMKSEGGLLSSKTQLFNSDFDPLKPEYNKELDLLKKSISNFSKDKEIKLNDLNFIFIFIFARRNGIKNKAEWDRLIYSFFATSGHDLKNKGSINNDIFSYITDSYVTSSIELVSAQRISQKKISDLEIYNEELSTKNRDLKSKLNEAKDQLDELKKQYEFTRNELQQENLRLKTEFTEKLNVKTYKEHELKASLSVKIQQSMAILDEGLQAFERSTTRVEILRSNSDYARNSLQRIFDSLKEE